MATGPQPQRVAKRALILGAIAFRSSLEVTNHPRVVEISQKLMPWLHELACEDELDPIERELLTTPLGQLNDSQRIDANWAGEAATFFCWTLNLLGPLEAARPADQSRLPSVLFILKPGANDILQSASLREITEIQDLCREYVLIRSILQETRFGTPVSDIIRRTNLQRLADVGLDVTEDAVKRASETVARMTPEERSRSAGLYFVRDHAALWFFRDRPNYFDQDATD